MATKMQLKKKYKQLVREGKRKDAIKLLKEIQNYKPRKTTSKKYKKRK